MIDPTKLEALRTRLIDAQRTLIDQAADAGTSPAAIALQRIADLESAIVAVDAMMEEE